MEPSQPRILMIGPDLPAVSHACTGAVMTRVTHAGAASDTLRNGTYDAVIADPAHVTQLIDRYRRDETILANLDHGIASLDRHGVVTWANGVLKAWCGADPVGKTLFDALAPCTAENPEDTVLTDHPTQFRLQQPPPSPRNHLDVLIRPVVSADGSIHQRVAIIHDATKTVEDAQKLDTLHEAGFHLTELETCYIGDVNFETRVDHLKENLLNYVHDLLHYDTIEVRLLDRRTMELLPLVQDGMSEEAANRRLWAREEGNGVTGYVAFTGKSYLCPDASKDTHYLVGAMASRSSLTVPLKHGPDVVGTLNVESPEVNGFGPKDLQFTERLARELAAAIHQLDLLKAQQACTVAAIFGEVSREIAISQDEVLATAAKLYARLHDKDPDSGALLRWILVNARKTREGIAAVHERHSLPGALDQGFTLSGKRVLVVDQLERWRRHAHSTMEKMGVHVETVTDPEAGLALMDIGKYDAVFLELRPLNMRGYETFRKFRLIDPEARICLTQICMDYDASHTKVLAGQDGMTALLVKPFREEQITNALSAGCPPKPTESALSHAAEVV